MKIVYKVGDVCNAIEPMIAHGCNAQGVMGSGVARFVKEKWPGAFQIYRQQYDRYGLELGQVVYYNDGKTIANCITQNSFGYDGNMYVDYNAIRVSMLDVYAYAVEAGYTAVALPKIGAGRGGGDWNVIAGIIEEIFTNVQPVVYMYEE